MLTTAVAVLVVGTVLGLLVLAGVLVVAVDRVRSTTERLVAARDDVLPAVDRLREDVERAQEHAARLRAEPLRVRADDGHGRSQR